MLDGLFDSFDHDEGKGRVEDADAGKKIGLCGFADLEFVSTVGQILDPIITRAG